MTFLLADPQDITREGFKTLLTTLCSPVTSIEIEKENELVAQLSAHPASVVIIDYTLFDTTEEQLLVLSQRFPAANFVLFSEQLSKDFLRRIILGNPRFHVLSKNCKLHEITEGLRSACAGHQFVCERIKEWMTKNDSVQAARTPLTPTEKEILKALAMGRTTKEIASERFLSVYTVMTHRKNIFRKLGVNNAREAVRYALRAGIVDVMEYYI